MKVNLWSKTEEKGEYLEYNNVTIWTNDIDNNYMIVTRWHRDRWETYFAVKNQGRRSINIGGTKEYNLWSARRFIERNSINDLKKGIIR